MHPFAVKAKLKAISLAKRWRAPMAVRPTDEFYEKHWRGYLSGQIDGSQPISRSFFIDSDDVKQVIRAYDRYFPESRKRIIASADEVIANVHDLLGSGKVRLDDEINWHQDFKTGYVWPQKSYDRIQLVDLSNNADVKVPWELSRLQFTVDLGRAFWFTSDSRYADKYIELLSDWEDANPIDIGVNWSCSMEVAIRAINMIWSLQLFCHHEGFATTIAPKIVRLLYYHARHIERNLEITTTGANSNHLISNYMGLYYIGLLLPEFDAAQEWHRVGKEGLEREIAEQVYEDGSDYECSTSYHRLVLEMFLSSFILGFKNDDGFSDFYISRLKSMIGFSAAMTGKSGKTPLIGDNDDGCVVKLGCSDPADHCGLVATGNELFGLNLKIGARESEEQIFYLQDTGKNRREPKRAVGSQLFSDGGYGIVRTDNFHLTFNLSTPSPGNFGGHKHNDLLSITLEIDGKALLVDPGTACYTSDESRRNLSRSTSMHNTMMVDGEEQNRFLPKRLFYLYPDGQIVKTLWTNDGELIVASAMHTGYRRLPGRPEHTRSIYCHPPGKRLIVIDQLCSDDDDLAHEAAIHWLTPAAAELTAGGVCRVSGTGGSSLWLETYTRSPGSVQVRPSEYFPRYGVTEGARQIQAVMVDHTPLEIVTSISYGDTINSNSDLISAAHIDMRRMALRRQEFGQ